jgi:HEXXH motif-containing protein
MAVNHQLEFHRLSWMEFDDLARGFGRPSSIWSLRRTERSRRLALLRAMVDTVDARPDLAGPLSSMEYAWQLLTRVQETAPRVLDLLLDHPYAGTWIGHTTRLLNAPSTVDGPLWMLIGYLHAMAAAAAIRAELTFETRIPLWRGNGILPTLGMVHLPDEPAHGVANVLGDGNRVEIITQTTRCTLPDNRSVDTPTWWAMRTVSIEDSGLRLALRFDDLDPYRSLYPPDPPQRMSSAEADSWRELLGGAWRLIVGKQRDLGEAIVTGFNSLVPRPAVAFGDMSASTAEAFGSAIIAKPADAESLAATLVHEFQHVRLSGLLQVATLHNYDATQRFYTPWRDDPRPVGGVLQGIYAFFGVTEFWRGLADGNANRRAAFEFAHWRAGTWRVLEQLRRDPALTEAGQRFVSGIAERLGPWQAEPVPEDVVRLAETVATDHYAGWRIRHIRPNAEVVDRLANAWLSDRRWPDGLEVADDQPPTPESDGEWSGARTELIRLSVTESRPDRLASLVADATEADHSFVAGRYADAVRDYQTRLAADPEQPTVWIGLGIALSASGTEPMAARGLLGRPELVRAVSRRIQHDASPVELAAWLGSHLDAVAAGSHR